MEKRYSINWISTQFYLKHLRRNNVLKPFSLYRNVLEPNMAAAILMRVLWAVIEECYSSRSYAGSIDVTSAKNFDKDLLERAIGLEKNYVRYNDVPKHRSCF